MALEHVPRCQHVKVNGVQCGSPALRHRTHCFFHTRVEHERQVAIESNSGKRSFGFPLLEDANSIQVALMKVIQMLGSGTLDHKTAGLMIYALQTASYNLKNAKIEPEKLSEVVIDEDTVDLTRMKGPQWSARDFAPAPAAPQSEVESKVRSEAHSQPEGETKKEAADESLADLKRRREQKRNLSPEADDEPQSLIKTWLQELGVVSHEGERIKPENQPALTAGSPGLEAEASTLAASSS